jgi:hypothetical protein
MNYGSFTKAAAREAMIFTEIIEIRRTDYIMERRNGRKRVDPSTI